jgi:thiamine biosynthesis lipoprotein
MCDAVRAGLRAARRSGGLVDPTLLDELEEAGYVGSRDGVAPAPLAEALLFAPARRPARPDPRACWRAFSIDEPFGLIRRPPGVRIDTGGIGKGLAADMVADRLAGYSRFVVDCGGDLRVGGLRCAEEPFEVLVEHPLSHEHHHAIVVGGGAVATSGLDVRVWRRADGGFAHHLLDPSTGEPAWTGLIGATALAGTAVEAETLSKAALLSGPDGARKLLSSTGGLIVHDDGQTEAVGPIDSRPRYRITVPESLITGLAA